MALRVRDIDTHNHEEGGWIYMNLVQGGLTVRRQSAKGHTSVEVDDDGKLKNIAINLDLPPEVPDSVVVGNFHVHPNGPQYNNASADDGRSISSKACPGLLRDSLGLGTYGPARRANLTGYRGYPLI